MLIGLTGKKGSGKDSLCSHILFKTNGVSVMLAGPLKEMLKTLLRMRGVSEAEISRMIDGDLKEVPHRALNGKTFRHAAQTLGTEWGRQMISDTLWVDAAADAIETHLGHGRTVVVTDVRYPNEEMMIRSLGGWLVKVERPVGLTDEGIHHSSETDIEKILPDYVVKNDGTLDDLEERASEVLSFIRNAGVDF